jgi:hypothetical protein
VDICIPLDVISVIAEHLVIQNLRGTCAALNVSSKLYHEETNPKLWRRVVYRYKNSKNGKKKAADRCKVVFGSSGAKHIQ